MIIVEAWIILLVSFINCTNAKDDSFLPVSYKKQQTKDVLDMKIQKIETANENYNDFNVFVTEGRYRNSYNVLCLQRPRYYHLIIMYFVLAYLYVMNIFSNNKFKIDFAKAIVEYCNGNYDNFSVVINRVHRIFTTEDFEKEFGVSVPF